MMRLKPAAVARAVVDGCQTTLRDFADEIIVDEESMTDRLFGSVANALNGRAIGNVVWKARTLRTGRGVAAEEKRHGADVLGVLEIALPEYKTKKGFLVQAKRIEPGSSPSKKEWERFQAQCAMMRERSEHAFAAIYTRIEGVRFIPAATIGEIRREQVFDVGSRSLFGFFRSHVKCEIGDRRLNSPTIDTLDAISRKAQSADFKDLEPLVLAMKVGG
jgi:hypothetical protein